MRKAIFFIFLIVPSIFVFAQTNYDKFKKLYTNNDTTKIETLLAEWKKESPNDPDLYTSAINFYFSNSKQEIISLNLSGQTSKELLQITDSSGKNVGYINSNIGYNPFYLNKAIKYANEGIDKFPDRLDIRFGKCHILRQIEDYENFSLELIKVVDYSLVNKNKWLWAENKKQEDGEDFMLATIQQYLKQLYDTQDDSLLVYMVQIGESTLKYYKNNIEILSSTAVALLLTNKYDKAIEYLKQAEQLNPKDLIVLNNIAQAYKLKDDKENAIKYFELIVQYGDNSHKQNARQNIKKLKE